MDELPERRMRGEPGGPALDSCLPKPVIVGPTPVESARAGMHVYTAKADKTVIDNCVMRKHSSQSAARGSPALIEN